MAKMKAGSKAFRTQEPKFMAIQLNLRNHFGTDGVSKKVKENGNAILKNGVGTSPADGFDPSFAFAEEYFVAPGESPSSGGLVDTPAVMTPYVGHMYVAG